MEIKQLPHNHGANTEALIREREMAPDITTFKAAADTFALLGDASRLKIFWLLCHTEECVANIAAAVDMSAPAVSHHLKALKNAKILQSRKDGKEVYYKLADTYEADLLHKAADSFMNIKCPSEVL